MPDDIGCGCAGIGMEKCVKNVGDGEAVAAGAGENGCSGYNRSDAEEFERGTAPILSSKIGGIGRRLRVNNGFVHGLHRGYRISASFLLSLSDRPRLGPVVHRWF